MTGGLTRQIKRVDKAELMRLSRQARELHLNAGRRADWIDEHVQDGPIAFLRPALHELSPQPCYRTLVLARRTNGSTEHFRSTYYRASSEPFPTPIRLSFCPATVRFPEAGTVRANCTG